MKNPTLTPNNISQMVITLKKSTLLSVGQGVGQKGNCGWSVSGSHPVCSDCLSLFHVEPCCASVATPPLPGLQVILLKDTGHLGGCSLGPSVSGVGEVEMVWTEIEVASRSWLMATPLRLRFLGHPTCSHHVVVWGWCRRPSDTGVCWQAPQVEGHFS